MRVKTIPKPLQINLPPRPPPVPVPTVNKVESRELTADWWNNGFYQQCFEQAVVPRKKFVKSVTPALPIEQHCSEVKEAENIIRKHNRLNGVNQLGGSYQSGRPLPDVLREQIVTLWEMGMKPKDISQQLQVSHGGVSKILLRYRHTGDTSPGKIGGSKRVKSTPEIVSRVTALRAANPKIRATEIQTRLLVDGVCDEKKLPSVSLINRILRQKISESAANSGDCTHKQHTPQFNYSSPDTGPATFFFSDPNQIFPFDAQFAQTPEHPNNQEMSPGSTHSWLSHNSNLHSTSSPTNSYLDHSRTPSSSGSLHSEPVSAEHRMVNLALDLCMDYKPDLDESTRSYLFDQPKIHNESMTVPTRPAAAVDFSCIHDGTMPMMNNGLRGTRLQLPTMVPMPELMTTANDTKYSPAAPLNCMHFEDDLTFLKKFLTPNHEDAQQIDSQTKYCMIN